ncbi:MAG: hypothetical protein IPP89_02905 [Saprospiraceae bacterium]|nr:hypothetical protein [Candidatus Brachybacter algidus]MBL0117938.1 hypothetical protein [Candidatus Brachybacter algidus]
MACIFANNSAIGQKRAKSKKTIEQVKVIPRTPFNFLIGNWASYNKEATFAAYINVKVIAGGSALEIHLEKPDGTMSVGLIYSDPISDNWKLAWVGPDQSNSRNGVRDLQPDGDPKRIIFLGLTNLDNKRALDRYIFENVNSDTVVKIYEISTDNGITWDQEYKYTFKKTQ